MATGTTRLLRALAICLGMAGCAQGGTKVSLTLPLHAETKRCYEGVERIGILGPAVTAMTQHAREDAPFARRLEEIMRARRTAVEAFRKQTAGDPKDMEESVFVCAADDLLEAVFLHEVEEAHRQPPAERAPRLDFLRKAVRGLDLNPAWNDYTRKRILEAADRAK
jgi:hypothetical protein